MNQANFRNGCCGHEIQATYGRPDTIQNSHRGQVTVSCYILEVALVSASPFIYLETPKLHDHERHLWFPGWIHATVTAPKAQNQPIGYWMLVTHYTSRVDFLLYYTSQISVHLAIHTTIKTLSWGFLLHGTYQPQHELTGIVSLTYAPHTHFWCQLSYPRFNFASSMLETWTIKTLRLYLKKQGLGLYTTGPCALRPRELTIVAL